MSAARVGENAKVRIRGDGEGLDSATGAALFERGLSTRPHKSGGPGLHWCASVLTATDGSMRRESEGRGRGATAVVTLRAAAAGTAVAA